MSLPLHIDEPYETANTQKNCWHCREIIIKYDLVKDLSSRGNYGEAGTDEHVSRWVIMRNVVINEYEIEEKNTENWCQSITLNTDWDWTAFIFFYRVVIVRLSKHVVLKGETETNNSTEPYVQCVPGDDRRRTNAQTSQRGSFHGNM